MVARDRRRDAVASAGADLRRPRRGATSARWRDACAARCSSSPAPTTRSRRYADGRGAGGRDRRRAGHGARGAATSPRRASRCRSTSRCASSSSGGRPAARSHRPPRGRPAQAGAVHLLADRARARAARRRDRARAARTGRRSCEVDWLAQDPVTALLEAEGERIHPASQHLANESRHIESESAEHDLHCFQAWRRMDEILVANFMVFHDVVREDRYDLWIGDEALGDRLLPAREPAREARALRLADRLRRLAAHARRRRRRGGADRRLQRRDGRAHRAPSAGPRPGAVRGQRRRRRARPARPRAAADPRLDRRQLRLRRLRERLRPGDAGRPVGAAGASSATATTSACAS